MNTAKPANYLKLTQVAVFCFYLAVGYVPRRSQRFGTQNASQPGRPPIHPYRRTSKISMQ